MFVDISDNIDLIVVVDHVVGCVPDPYVLFYYDLPVAVADDHAVEYDLFALYTNYRK